MSPDVPESTVKELHALYREAAADQPGSLLDRAILEAARDELRADHAVKRQTPWWKRWLPATTAIAAVVIGLSVTWRVMDEQERRVREEMGSAEAAGETSRQAVPAESSAATKPAANAPPSVAEKSRRLESKAVQDSAHGVPAPAAPPAAGSEPRPSPAAAPAAMAPAPAEPELKKSRRAEADDLRERRDANTAADSASGLVRQAGKLEAQRSGVDASAEAAARSAVRPAAKSLAAPVIDAATPEAWLGQIRELRVAGRSTEAAQSLMRFRARYPAFELPADLLDLK